MVVTAPDMDEMILPSPRTNLIAGFVVIPMLIMNNV